ncbi:MAG: peptidylprolyl isomerase [Patescibacteria group bacterium]|nr:peptidylprolyl isomerase [Patescibacteria group bacterium]
MSSKNNKKAKIIYEGKQKNNNNKKKFSIIISIIGVLILTIAILGIVSGWNFYIFNSDNNNLNDNPILVSINGEEIYQTDIDEQWNSLPIQTRASITREQILEELINEKLLLQKAEELNISMSKEEVEESIEAQLIQLGSSIDEYKQILEAQESNFENIIDMYQRQLTIAKLFEEETSAEDLNISQEEVQSYYENNEDEFFQEEKVKVRHILSSINEEVNESEALQQSEELLDQIESNENIFCELVSNFSMDPGSIQNCGEYSFGKGVMVEEFENASFSMEIGEYRIVKTDFGYHLINKLESIPEMMLKLDDEISELPGTEVQDVIKQILLEKKAKDVFDNYIDELKENTTIIYQ